jgi:hypothetical protein
MVRRPKHIERGNLRQAPRDIEPAPQPDALAGCWAEVAVAARLNGLSEVEVLQAVLDRRVRAERRRGGALVVELSDVAKLANEKGVEP